ncbi:MAG: folylpolyglutamate synthase/dihydrofolate synthase family protein [Planctomycetota bacterium]
MSPPSIDSTESRTDPPQAVPNGYAQALEFLFGRIDYERRNPLPPQEIGTDQVARPITEDNHPPFRLEGTRELFRRLGLSDFLAQPERRRPPVPLVHIAGTKGKGSTATMVSCILTAAGFRVGLYTSPHLTDLEERLRIDNRPCSKQSLIDLVSRMRPAVTAMEQAGHHPSFFELTTAMAVLYFRQSKCDVIVLEVGLGGRLDCTNVCVSSVAAITSIGLDHQRILGDTIEAIAAEKAGIIKGSVDVVSGIAQPTAKQVANDIAKHRRSTVFQLGTSFKIESTPQVLDGKPVQRLRYRPIRSELGDEQEIIEVVLALEGAHQARNAGVAISLALLLRRQGLDISHAAIARGLSEDLRCDGRMERFRFAASPRQPSESETGLEGDFQVIVDTAHNPDSVAALCQAIRASQERCSSGGSSEVGTTRGRLVFVFATSRDKDVRAMASTLLQFADEVICTRFVSNPRAVAAAELAECFRSQRSESMDAAGSQAESRSVVIHQLADPLEAFELGLKRVREKSGNVDRANPPLLVICGSFFLAGELRPVVLQMQSRQTHQDVK